MFHFWGYGLNAWVMTDAGSAVTINTMTLTCHAETRSVSKRRQSKTCYFTRRSS